jgi:hypothetical protein
VEQEGGVAAVVQQEVRAGAVGPLEGLHRAPPVLGEGLALPGVDRDAGRVRHRAGGADDGGGGGVVLRGEDVAAHPADVRAELDEGLDQDGGLHGHVQRAHDLRAGEGLLARVLLAQGGEAGHLEQGEVELLAAEPDGGLGEIGHLEREVGEQGEAGVEERGLGEISGVHGVLLWLHPFVWMDG